MAFPIIWLDMLKMATSTDFWAEFNASMKCLEQWRDYLISSLIFLYFNRFKPLFTILWTEIVSSIAEHLPQRAKVALKIFTKELALIMDGATACLSAKGQRFIDFESVNP